MSNLEFPTECPDVLGGVYREYGLAIAASQGRSPAASWAFILGAMSTVLGGCLGVRREHKSELYPVVLWTTLLAYPGDGKSKFFTPLLLRPLNAIQTELAGKSAERVAEYEADLVEAQALVNEYQSQAKAAAKKKVEGNDSGPSKRDARVAAQLALTRLKENPIAAPTLYSSPNITPETMGQRLAANGGRLSLISDEGTEVKTLFGETYDKNSNADARTADLRIAYDAGEISHTRVSGVNFRIPRACVTLSFAIQTDMAPGLFRAHMQSGLAHRLSVFAMPPQTEVRAVVRPTVPPALTTRYDNALARLARRYGQFEPNADGRLVPCEMTLEPEAEIKLQEIEMELERDRVAAYQDLNEAAIQRASALSKAETIIVRMAALVCLSHERRSDTSVPQITRSDVEGAYALWRYTYACARELLGIGEKSSVDRDLGRFKKYCTKLAEGGRVGPLTYRDLHPYPRLRAVDPATWNRLLRIAQVEGWVTHYTEIVHDVKEISVAVNWSALCGKAAKGDKVYS